MTEKQKKIYMVDNIVDFAKDNPREFNRRYGGASVADVIRVRTGLTLAELQGEEPDGTTYMGRVQILRTKRVRKTSKEKKPARTMRVIKADGTTYLTRENRNGKWVKIAGTTVKPAKN